ncbi:helix-turn-helix domain-containing protein [Streptomyces specialis]|uniref:helix-turn-helix domain-containing protein n=1 Tax=Streptomyces specialis TaxID=498367 RepID=UPI00073EB6CE
MPDEADRLSRKVAGLFRCGVTPYEIGHFLEIDTTEVTGLLTDQRLDPGTGRRKLPLRRRMGWRERVADLLRAEYECGASTNELAQRHGRTQQNVHTLLIEAGTDMRRPGRQQMVVVVPRQDPPQET